MRDADSYEAQRKARWRAHRSGEHHMCDDRTCPEARAAWAERQAKLNAKALMDECARRRLNPSDYFDDVAATLADIASLDEAPDIVSQLQARALIKLTPRKGTSPEDEFVTQILEQDEPERNWRPKVLLQQNERNERWD